MDSSKPTILLLIMSSAFAQGPQGLLDKSLEDLMDTRVTSVSKKEQPLSKVPAAIGVISAEEIRRSGATNIPDVLRIVPGLNVAQVTASGWAISARGFSDQFSSKMLVMVDGRSVYDPLFAGTLWDIQDIPLDDIERIEVIRGPGATMWGTNAVNGVINIITKSADQTQGALITAGGGSVERAFGTAQYGGTAGRRGHYRVFSQYSDRNNSNAAAFADKDDQRVGRAGFRGDWNLSAADKLMVQSQVYDSEAHAEADLLFGTVRQLQQLFPITSRVAAGDIMARWEHAWRNGSQTTLQVSYDQDVRGYKVLQRDHEAANVDFQHHFGIGQRDDFVWGLGYRGFADDTTGSRNLTFYPASRALKTFNAFAQDEIEVARERLWVTLGVKFERNSYSGVVTEPSAKLSWALNVRNTIWASVSKADRIPSRVDTGLQLQLAAVGLQDGLPLVPGSYGTPGFRPETLRAYELGYRAQPSKRLSLDFATYYNRYYRLRSSEPGTPYLDQSASGAQLIIPFYAGNEIHGAAYGAEVEATWKPVKWWSVDSSYTWFNPVFHRNPSSQDQTTVGSYEGREPRNRFSLHSWLNLPHRFEFDQTLYAVDSLAFDSIPAYTRYDVRIGWHATEAAEFSLVGENLLQPQHLEFGSSGNIYVATPVRRGFYGKMTWHF